jgi:uncharacterized protein (TIGR02231 family)
MTDINAPITSVTVYTDRAMITRKGSLTLEAGEHEIHLNNLPQFLPDSLRATGRGPQGMRILNVEQRRSFYPRPPDAEINRLQTEIEQAQHQFQVLKARQDALNDRRAWLRALGEQSKDFAHGLAQGQMRPQDCADFFSFMSTQAAQDAEAALNLTAQIEQAQRELESKQRELRHQRGSGQPDRRAAMITVELTTGGEIELECSYLVSNASWHPQYDVRVQLDEGQENGHVELIYIGMVQQGTGERWENVELSLSTAQPALTARVPEIEPWYLSVPVPPPPMQPMAAQQAYSALQMSRRSPAPAPAGGTWDLEAEATRGFTTPPAPVEAEIATTTLERSGSAFTFRVGHNMDIPSDNTPHKTTIAHDRLPCVFDYVCAPAIETNAHVRATITNTTERVLLTGQASIFLTNTYVGTTPIEQIATNEEFKLFLGIDDSLKIKREPVERNVDRGGILTQNGIRRSTYAYRITVHNYAPTTRKIVIRDHLPVSQHERIKVKIQNVTPPPTEHTRLELITWEFSLPSERENKLEYRFIIEHPQDLQVTGMP